MFRCSQSRPVWGITLQAGDSLVLNGGSIRCMYVTEGGVTVPMYTSKSAREPLDATVDRMESAVLLVWVGTVKS